jgi:GNAT superfamily N-acetyltransferase
MDALTEEVMVAPRYAFPRPPDLRVIERPGWLQIVTPSIKTGGCNEVIYSLLDEAGADAAIDEAIAIYRDLGLQFRWNTGPGSGPPDLGERLARRGLRASWGRGMARTIDEVAAPPDVALVDASTLDAFTAVMAEGWASDITAMRALNRHIFAEGRQCMFLAYADGVPAATAAYVPLERSAYLVGGVVLPAYRGRGLYRALIQARLAHARARGLALATSHARESSSAPILEKLGFETACRFAMYFG